MKKAAEFQCFPRPPPVEKPKPEKPATVRCLRNAAELTGSIASKKCYQVVLSNLVELSGVQSCNGDYTC